MTPARSRGYLAFLLGYLTLAEFFDAFATAFRYHMTTYVRQDFGVELPVMLRMLSWVYVGTLLGFLPRMAADVVGRRIALAVVTAGLCAFQWLVGFARTPGEYAALLAVLAVFYKADLWTLVMSEEAPRTRRGLWTAMPVLLGGTGAVALGALVRHMGDDASAWRAVARMPVWGLPLVVVCALVMRETHAFLRVREERRRAPLLALALEPFRAGHARPLLVLTMLKLVYVAGATAALAMLGSEFLRVHNGFDPGRVGRLIQLQTIAMVVGAVFAGWLSDRVGRLATGRGAAICYGAALAAMVMVPVGSVWVAVCYVLQAFFDAGVICVLRLGTLECFPSRFRSTGSAWTEVVPTAAAIGTAQLLGAVTAAGVGVPAVILAVAVLVVLVVPAFGLLRETRGVDLETVADAAG